MGNWKGREAADSQAAHPSAFGSEALTAGLFNDKCPQAANELLIQWLCEAEDEEGGRRMMEGNSTAGSFTPLQQFSIADLVVVVVYFSLNVAVGIWVRIFSLVPFLLSE